MIIGCSIGGSVVLYALHEDLRHQLMVYETMDVEEMLALHQILKVPQPKDWL